MPIPAGVALQGIMGLGQMVGGAIGAAKGRSELKSLLLRSPQYQADQGIMGLYNQALQRFGASPTQSALYKSQMQNLGKIGAGGMRGLLQQRGGVLGGTSSLTNQLSNAALNAEVAAEQQRNQLFGQAMSAGQLASRELGKEFDINVMRPWDIRAQMAGQRAAGGAQTFNIGASNVFGAGSTLAQSDMYKRYYDSLRGKKTTPEPPVGG